MRSPRTNGKRAKLDHDPVRRIRLANIRPAFENSQLYRPVDPADPEIIELAKSIKKYGIKEPLVISRDRYILSGHRRHCAAGLAGLKTAPCRVEDISWIGDSDRFVTLLREYNRQRDKSLDEKLREEVVSANPDEAYASLIEHREEQVHLNGEGCIKLRGRKERSEISAAKMPFLKAITAILRRLRDYWPLSDRRIHYVLLNDPPLRHASKPDSTYENTPQSYKSLTELLTRARLAGYIRMEAIADETRPVCTWNVHPDPRSFMRKEIDGFLKRYWRDYQQSQPNHLEVVGEKNTILPILKPVCMEYCIPLTTGRGFCSLPPRYAMAQRYEKSGKDKLVLLIVSDLDCEGEEIAHSFARSMRDDFGIEEIHPVKVALTHDQAIELDLPRALKAKKSSVNYRKFAEKYGDDAWEVEALPPETLQEMLRDAIDNVLDVDAFNAELDAEKQDATYLQGVRQQVNAAFRGMEFQQDGEEMAE